MEYNSSNAYVFFLDLEQTCSGIFQEMNMKEAGSCYKLLRLIYRLTIANSPPFTVALKKCIGKHTQSRKDRFCVWPEHNNWCHLQE